MSLLSSIVLAGFPFHSENMLCPYVAYEALHGLCLTPSLICSVPATLERALILPLGPLCSLFPLLGISSWLLQSLLQVSAWMSSLHQMLL